ncbi:hypothetical protein D9M68_859540 [compost metagenome]
MYDQFLGIANTFTLNIYHIHTSAEVAGTDWELLEAALDIFLLLVNDSAVDISNSNHHIAYRFFSIDDQVRVTTLSRVWR